MVTKEIRRGWFVMERKWSGVEVERDGVVI